MVSKNKWLLRESRIKLSIILFFLSLSCFSRLDASDALAVSIAKGKYFKECNKRVSSADPGAVRRPQVEFLDTAEHQAENQQAREDAVLVAAPQHEDRRAEGSEDDRRYGDLNEFATQAA